MKIIEPLGEGSPYAAPFVSVGFHSSQGDGGHHEEAAVNIKNLRNLWFSFD